MHRWFMVTLALLVAGPVFAKTIVVIPGPGTPIQDAIDAAAPGDRIRLETVPGDQRFPEAVRVTKSLRIIGDSLAIIDPGCSAPIAIEVAADDVALQGFYVYGGADTAVDIQNRDGVKVKLIYAYATSGPDGCDTARYGFNVVNSTNVKITVTHALRHDEASLRIANVPAGGHVAVKRLRAEQGGTTGVLVENTTTAPGSPPAVRLDQSLVRDAMTGILLTNTDGIRLSKNTVNAITTGIRLDANSDDNVLLRNTSYAATVDVADDGTNNCWIGTLYDTGTIVEGNCD